jgi:hypothetical protein
MPAGLRGTLNCIFKSFPLLPLLVVVWVVVMLEMVGMAEEEEVGGGAGDGDAQCLRTIVN